MDNEFIIEDLASFKNQFDFFSKIIIGNFWFKDVKGVYLGCNDAVAKLLGFRDCKAIIGKTDYELPWKKDAARLLDDDKKVIASRKAHHFEEKVLSNGKIYIFKVTKVPLLNHDNQTIGTLGVSIDVTKHKLINNLSNTNKKQRMMLETEKKIKKEQEKL